MLHGLNIVRLIKITCTFIAVIIYIHSLGTSVGVVMIGNQVVRLVLMQFNISRNHVILYLFATMFINFIVNSFIIKRLCIQVRGFRLKQRSKHVANKSGRIATCVQKS